MQRIPVSLITGFLGSGKTSLVNKLLSIPEAAGTAVVVNEFGEIGLDHELIVASDDKVMLLANGCFCCAMKGDLVMALDKLYRGGLLNKAASFQRVVIETSGLADASPVIQLLLSEPSITARYRLDGVVTVVDAINGEASLDAHVESVKQVAVADSVILTKTDLLGSDANLHVAALAERIKAINRAAPVEDASALGRDRLLVAVFPGASDWLRDHAYSAEVIDKPLGLSGPKDLTGPKGHDQRFSSFCYVRDEAIGELSLRLLLEAIGENLGPQLLRIKGIVNVLEYPDRPAVIHGAQKLLHDVEWLEAWPSDDRRSRIVFITLDAGRALVEELIEMADRLAANTARARLRAGRA